MQMDNLINGSNKTVRNVWKHVLTTDLHSTYVNGQNCREEKHLQEKIWTKTQHCEQTELLHKHKVKSYSSTLHNCKQNFLPTRTIGWPSARKKFTDSWLLPKQKINDIDLPRHYKCNFLPKPDLPILSWMTTSPWKYLEKICIFPAPGKSLKTK